LQNPSQINGDNLQNLRRETSRIFRKKKREYWKDEINELEINNKNKNITDLHRGISEFKKGYQPRINIIKDENGNLLADLRNVLNMWKNFFKQVLNVHGVHNNRPKDTHTHTHTHTHTQSLAINARTYPCRSGNCYWKVEKL
jgi:hypothetical protein